MVTETACYQFDKVEVQPAAFAVLRDGQALPLEPKAVRVLLYLIEHRDRAVSKEELIEAVWEGVAVTDNALTRIVAQLRRELGDDARQARYIQTLPTLGYRFIAELRVVSSQPAPGRRTRSMVIASAAGLAVAVLAAWLLMGHGSAVAPSAELQPLQLTTSPAVDMAGSFSPDGNSFAYSSNRSGWFEIFTRPVSPGGAEKQVTTDGKQNIEPAWSPDGKSIVYHSVAQHGIWLIPVSGGTPQRLAAFGSAPAWSPDGRQIAFRSLEPYSLAWFDFPGIGESTIWTVASDGSQLRRLTTPANPRGQHAMASWSPDGKRVAFTAFGGSTSVWAVDVSSSEVKPLTAPDVWCAAPLLAPNGDGLYCTGISKSGNFGIYRIPAAGGNLAELYSTRNDVPAGMTLSRDGKRLLYTRISNISQLWLSGTGSEDAKPIYTDAVIRARLPAFSPDGKRLVYIVRTSGRNDDLWMMNADGSGAALVAADPAISGMPSWNADGTAILYSHCESGRYQLRQIHPGDRSMQVLWQGQAPPMNMSHITTDQRDVFFVRPAPANLWKLTVKGGAPKQFTFDREGASFPSPSWDGQWIAYELNRGDTVQIGIADRDGGHQEILTDDAALNWSNSWASDNRRIAFAAYKDGVWNLNWIDRVTRERKQITHYTAFGAFVRNPAWRPGTEQVAYEYSQVKGNVYMMNLP